MTLNFVIPEFNIGGAGTPPLEFFRRGFNLGGSGSSPSWKDIILHGNTALTLVNSKANGLNYLKLFGGTEQTSVPSGYTQIEGVNNSSSTYVNTGLCPTVDDVEFEIRTKASSTTSWYLFQSRKSSGTNIYGLSGSSSGGTIVLACGGTNLTSNITRTVGNIYTIKASLKNGVSTLYVKDETAGAEDTVTGTYTYSQPSTDICLFGNTSGSQTISENNTIYYARLKVSGAYVMNYIPAMQGSTVGFYDKVSNSLKIAAEGTLSSSGSAVPSPNNPIDIVCNNGVLKLDYTSKNLNVGTLDNQGYTSTGGTSSSTTFCGTLWKIKVSEGEKYTVSYGNFPDGISGVFINTWKTDGTWNLRQAISISSSYTYTIPSGIGAVNFTLYKTGGITIGSNSWMQVEKGETATAYVPAGYSLQTKGIVEQVCAKDQYNILPANAEPDILYPINVAANGTYTFSANVNGGQNLSAVQGRFYNADKQQINYYTLNTFSNGRMYKSFSLTTATKYVSITRTSSYATTPVTDLKVEKGSTMTPYYSGGSATAEMLLKVGTYQDEQSVLDGVVTRNVGIKVFDGTENFFASGVGWAYSITDKLKSKTEILCTHYPYSSATMANAPDKSVMTFSSQNIGFKDSAFTSSTDVQTFCLQQYNAGTPVIVVYPLAEPTTETVTGQPLTIQAGTNIVEITQASMDDLELEVSYKAGVEVTVTEIENAQLDNSVEVTVNG